MFRAPRQNSGENGRARRLASLHSLGQRAVEDALPIAGRVAIGDAKGGQHLFRRQADQFARGRGRAKDPHRRGAMPTSVQRARKRDAARHIQTQSDRQKDITPTDTPEAVA